MGAGQKGIAVGLAHDRRQSKGCPSSAVRPPQWLLRRVERLPPSPERYGGYPEVFPQNFDLEYNPETKVLIVEYSLPAPEHLPRLKEVKFVKSKDDFTESFLSENELNKLYDDTLYQICLRAPHELFEADDVNTIAAISFNGWVNSVDKATGKEANACVLSIQVKKDESRAVAGFYFRPSPLRFDATSPSPGWINHFRVVRLFRGSKFWAFSASLKTGFAKHG